MLEVFHISILILKVHKFAQYNSIIAKFKNHTELEKVGTVQNLFFGFIDELEKQIIK